MARDKEFEWRMQGMIYAANIVATGGIEALKEDIQKRNVLRAPMKFSSAQLDEFLQFICDNTRNTTFALTFTVLNEVFGFGEKRLSQFSDEFNKRFNACMDFNYLGEHYVTLEDFAIDISSKYKDLVLDIQRIAVCQDEHDKSNPDYKDTRFLNGIINSLRMHNYHDAADFLEKQKGEVVK